MNTKKDQNNNKQLTFWAGVFTIFICITFGANAVAIKMSFEGIGVFTTAALRFNIAAVVIFLWAWLTKKPLKLSKKQFKQIFILAMVFTVQLSMYYIGISKTHASRAVLIVNMHPFILLFLAHYFIPGDRITLRKFSGLLLGFVGLVVTFMDGTALTGDFRVGEIIMVVATFIWASNTVFIKRMLENIEPYQLVLYQMIFSVPFFYLEGFIFDPVMISYIDWKLALALFFQGVVTASIGFVAWTTLLRKYGAVNLHSFMFIMPVAGVLLSGLILHEPITQSLLIALFFIASGIVVINWKGLPFPIKRGEM